MPGARFRSAVFDVLVAAGVAGLTGLSIFMRETPPDAMVLGYGMAAAVLMRRRFPLTVMGVVGALALLQVILFAKGPDPLPFDLAVLVAMYSTVKYGRTMIDAAIAAGVVACGIVIEVARHFGPNWWALALWYIGVCGGFWLMAYTMRNRRLYVLSLEERAATLEREREHLARIAVADERATIARELHDVVAHSLAVMIVQADGGRYALDADPGAARSALDTVAATGREALEDMRRLVEVLRGTAPAASAPADETDRRALTIDQLDTLVQRGRSAGLDVVASCGEPPESLPAGVQLAVYRIVQEALTNVLTHAGPRARVVLGVDYTADAIRMSIVDDGGARDDVNGAKKPAGRPGGHGLVGMRERVSVHGGTFEAGARLDGGWSVQATIPLNGPPSRPNPLPADQGRHADESDSPHGVSSLIGGDLGLGPSR
jgi:signal transduction histidine kinase